MSIGTSISIGLALLRLAAVADLTRVPLPTAKARLRRGRLLLVDLLAGRPTPGAPVRAA